MNIVVAPVFEKSEDHEANIVQICKIIGNRTTASNIFCGDVKWYARKPSYLNY